MNKKRIRLDCLLTVLIAGGVISLLIWATMGEIERNPSRQAMVEMGSYGLVTVQLVTDPYPALAAKPVTLEFMLMNARGQSIQPDSFSFEYGRKDNDQPVRSGTIEAMTDGSEMMMTKAEFPSAGTWWVRANFAKDGYEENAQFTIDVKPQE